MVSEFTFQTNNIKHFNENNTYSSEHDGMRFKIFKDKTAICSSDAIENETQTEKQVLFAVVWPCPWCMEKTDEALIKRNNFELSNDGLNNAVTWIIEQYENDKAYWNSFNTGLIF